MPVMCDKNDAGIRRDAPGCSWESGQVVASVPDALAFQALSWRSVSPPYRRRTLSNGKLAGFLGDLLVIANAAALIADPSDEAYLRDGDTPSEIGRAHV